MPNRLQRLEVHRVSLVDAGSNPGADVVLVKRKADAPVTPQKGGGAGTKNVMQKLKERIARVVKAMGLTTDEILAEREARDRWWDAFDAFTTSVYRIFDQPEADQAALLEATVREYAAQALEIIPALGGSKLAQVAQRAVEALTDVQKNSNSGDAGDAGVKETVVSLIEELAELRKAEGDENPDKGGTMNVQDVLKGLPEDQRKLVEAEISRLNQELEAAKVVKAKDPSNGDPGKTGDNADDINKAELPEAVRKRMDDLEAEAAQARAERVARRVGELTTLAKRVAAADDVAPLAQALQKVEAVDKESAALIVKAIENAASVSEERSKLLREIGKSTGEETDDSAMAVAKSRVKKLLADKPDLAYEKALDQVFKADPELSERYVREQRGEV